MAKTLFILYAAALARASEESRLPNSARSRHLQEGDALIIEDFAGPADAFFLDDGSAAGLPSSGDSAHEKVDDGLRLNYDVARNGPFGAALMGKIWGGYRDLSNASSIRLTYRVEAASSLPGHAALGVVLLDGKACGLAPHCSSGVGLALTDYLASGNVVLDDVDAGGWRTLEIDLCGEANPYAPFFGLDREGRSLDPATIQGWRLGVVVDSLAGMGNAATGSIVFGELAAVGAGPAPSPPCAPPPRAGARELVDVRVDKGGASQIFELGLRHCAEHCANDGDCAYFATDPRRNVAVGAYPSCYLFSELHEGDVSFAAPGAPDRVQTWWYEDVREDLCDACACDAATRRADCTRADLATAPRPQVPNELRAGFDPLEIDLSGNERLVVLGPGALSDFPSLERVTLPHALTYLAEDALPDGVRAASLEPGARRGRNFIDGGPTARFHDVCCSPGLTVGETLSFCDRAADAPGADATYEPYVKYLSDDIYAIVTAVSPLLAEAAASVELCAYYCGLIADCAAFAYDQLPVGTGATRTSDARVCTMFATVPRAREYIGANATNGAPGWVSGLPARSRAAEVVVEPSLLLLDAASEYEATYTIRLSAPPTRGSVWVTPHAVGEERTEEEAGERFCEQSGFSQRECESHDHGSCYCEWDEGECWWQEGACGANEHGRHGRRLSDGDVLAFYPPSVSLSASRMEVNVTVRLVNEEEEGHHGGGDGGSHEEEEEGHHVDGHAEAYHHDVHEDGDHGGYGPGHAAPVPAGGTATILVHHEIESCDAAFQLSARDHSADIRVTVRRPQHDDHDKHRDHRYQDHMRDMWLAVGLIAGAIGLALIFLGCWFVRNYTQRKRELELARALLVREQVLEARDRVAGFTAPFSVLPGAEFLALGGFETHETLLQRRVLDIHMTKASVDAARGGRIQADGPDGARRTGKTVFVFVSHQWLGHQDADPDNKQYEATCGAIQALAARHDVGVEAVRVWMDVLSVPQANRPAQALAISSLPSFAAACDVFLVVAPVATHANTLQRCDLASYRGRGWCRAEMLAFWARRGSADMYRATADAAVVPLFAGSIFSDSHECCLSEAAQSRGEERSEGMQGSFLDAMRVFDGEFTCCRMGHPNGQPCDRERLMLPMLGIYDERGAWARCREPRSPGPRPRTLEALEPARDALFPKTFEYVSVEGGNRTTETRPLFGDLVEAVQWYSEDPDRLHDGASQHSTSRCLLRRVRGRQCSGASKAFEPGTRAQRRATMGEKAHLSASTGSTFISPSLRSRSTRSVSLSLETTLPLGIATVPHSP